MSPASRERERPEFRGELRSLTLPARQAPTGELPAWGWDVSGEQRRVEVSRRSFLQSGALGACGVPASVGSDTPEARGAKAAEPIRLETSRLTVDLRRADGALVKLHNRLTDDVKEIRSVAFQLATTRGEVSPRDCRLLRSAHDARSATFLFAGKGLEVEVGYRIVPTGARTPSPSTPSSPTTGPSPTPSHPAIRTPTTRAGSMRFTSIGPDCGTTTPSTSF